jgi:hypothetical protein
MRRLVMPGLLVVCVACRADRNDGPDRTLAAVRLGPAGGRIEVTEGRYAGLRLVVPAGALAAPVTVRMHQPPPPPDGTFSPAVVPGPGPFVDIEPAALQFAVPATLRLPYVVQGLAGLGIGNVRADYVGPGGRGTIEPEVVDVEAGLAELSITRLGSYGLVRGARATSVFDYFGPDAVGLPLTDGRTFTLARAPVPQLGAAVCMHWTLDDVDDQDTETALLDGQFLNVLGRASGADWIEVWNPAVQRVIATAHVFAPRATATPLLTGAVAVASRVDLGPPVRVGEREFRDVLRVSVDIAWQRADLGDGARQTVYWFAPGVGLVQVERDGVVSVRSDL